MSEATVPKVCVIVRLPEGGADAHPAAVRSAVGTRVSS